MRRRVVAAVWSQGLETGSNGDAAAFARRSGPDHVADVAVADGVSTTLFAGDWSRMLVAAAVEGWGRLSLDDLVGRLESLRESFDPLSGRASTNPMVQEAWLIEGSAATLLAATLTADDDGFSRARAVTVGDTVLMVLSSDAFVTFPKLASTQFTSTPSLVSSVPGTPIDAQLWDTEIDRDAVVLFATDAVAAHLIRIVESQGPGALRHRLVELVDSARHHGLRGVDLAAVLLQGTGHATFHDDATLVVCADVPDRPAGDLDLLSAAVTGATPPPWSRVLGWVRRRLNATGTTRE